MPVSPRSGALLAHMVAVNNVPPPPPRSVPGLKISKYIDYGHLNALLLHMSKQQGNRSSMSILSAHSDFIKQYHKIFLQRKIVLPRLPKQEEKRKLSEDTEESQGQQPDRDVHNIAAYVKQALGGHSYGPRKIEDKVEKFLAILKKLPIHRTLQEHNIVWKMLKRVPDLASQLTDDNLKALSKNVVSETWIKGSTVAGNDGFYVILRGLVRSRTQLYKSVFAGKGSTAQLLPQSFHSFPCTEDLERSLEEPLALGGSLLGPWSTFGTLEVTPQIESDPRVYSVVTEEDCELLKISANNYAKLKSEKKKLEHKQTVKLIRACPYYEEWPTLNINELVLLVKWKKFPRGHVIVESGNIIPFVAYINSGHCNIYRDIVGLVKLRPKKLKKVRKLVYMGRLRAQESFGEVSILLQAPFTCTVIAGEEVELAVIQDEDLLALDPVTQQLMLQTAKPTFGHLKDEDVRNEYLQKELEKEWKHIKDKTLRNALHYNGIVPGSGKWEHNWTSVPRNPKGTLPTY